MSAIADLFPSSDTSPHAAANKHSQAIDKKMNAARDKWIKGIKAVVFSSVAIAVVVLSGGSLFALPVALKVAFVVAPLLLCSLGFTAKNEVHLFFHNKKTSEKYRTGVLRKYKGPTCAEVAALKNDLQTAIKELTRIQSERRQTRTCLQDKREIASLAIEEDLGVEPAFLGSCQGALKELDSISFYANSLPQAEIKEGLTSERYEAIRLGLKPVETFLNVEYSN